MSETAKLSPDLNDTRIVFANEETFEKMKDYIFYCPCSKCNAEMRIRSRTLNDGDKTYYFSSNSHNKEKCTVYKKSKEKVSIRNGIQTVNHAIFQDQERRGGEGGNNPPGPGGTNGPKRMDPGTFQFQEDNPRLNNIDDYIKFIINSSFFDKINIGTKRKPNFKTLSQILFRYDNFDNYRGHDLSGIGIVWGGRRINANALGIQVEKNSIIIQEDLPYQIYLQNIAPILFKLVFSSEKTKNIFLDQYFSFDSKTTLLIVVGDWKRQPDQNGYRIYSSPIGKKCFKFLKKSDLKKYKEI